MEGRKNCDAVIISGGSIKDEFVLDALQEIRNQSEGKRLLLIAADRGLDFFTRNGMAPDIAIGDFDSAAPGLLEELIKKQEFEVVRLKPEKDVSDTQAALLLAAERGVHGAVMFGCTGSRLDHVMANLALLLVAEKLHMDIVLRDPNNTIRLAFPGMILTKKEYGDCYISFFPLGKDVEGLTLRGFQYPLHEHTLTFSDAGLTISNRIVEEEAVVLYKSGSLALMITED